MTSDLPWDQLRGFLETGLEAVTTSRESREKFTNDLATEYGLARIRQIVEADFSTSYSVLKPMFYSHCVLFLRLISHDEIRHSLVLEKAVGTIYNVVYGHNGNRGIEFFRKVANCLTHKLSESEGVDVGNEVLREEALLLTTKALLSTLTLNQGAVIRTEFTGAIEQLRSCYRVEDISHGLASRNVCSAHENILKIEDIRSMGDTISASKTVSIGTTTSYQQWQLNVDLPGQLSGLGPRHDNDHALISDIRILPTLSEILNDQRAEYLPAQYDPNFPCKHHETGILRLLDSQFRLLREDTSGLLRDSICLVFENWNTLVQGSDWRTRRKILRDSCPTPVRTYTNVEIQRIKSDSIKGVQIEVEFDQVHGARTSNLTRRKQWWRESKGMREGGAILAIIDGEEKDRALIFLLVSTREVCSPGRNDSLLGTRHVRDLASDAKRAMVTLRLANPSDKADLSNLVDLAGRSVSTSRPLLLIEFPAILYNSFEGVLRCLQSLHKNPTYIPFSTWLAPRLPSSTPTGDLATTSTDGKTVIPPPAYLHNNVALDLSCIPISKSTNSNGTIASLTFSLSNDSQVLSTQLSEVTTLDAGQAAAMVSALKHELALIQGPPGTGKSYVGIQIARCLLKNRDLLGLGPILCV